MSNSGVSNLKSFGVSRSIEEARELGRKGGKKSGEVRRSIKSMREEALKWRDTGNNAEKFIQALVDSVMDEHNMKACELLISLCGENTANKVEVKCDGIASILSASNRLVNGDTDNET